MAVLKRDMCCISGFDDLESLSTAIISYIYVLSAFGFSGFGLSVVLLAISLCQVLF